MGYIKSYQVFESSTRLTREMAQEIIYYFGEQSYPIRDAQDIFYELFSDEEFVFYETSYSKRNEFIDKLLKLSKERNITDDLIELYYVIRNERKDFPEVYQIEDIFLNIIDDGFSFNVISRKNELRIILSKGIIDLDNYIKYINQISNYLKKLGDPKYFVTLEKSEILQGYREIDGKINKDDKYSYCNFIITLKV